MAACPNTKPPARFPRSSPSRAARPTSSGRPRRSRPRPSRARPRSCASAPWSASSSRRSRHAPLDEAGRARLREIYDISVQELASSLSPDLAAELDRITLPLEQETPSEAELRVAQAQLVGWLEG